MKVLFFSSAFPQPGDPSRSPYNRHRCEALGRTHDVRIISPRNWLHPRHAAAGTGETAATSLPIERPTFYYPPRIMRGSHEWWMWQSVRRTAKRMARGFRPDIVLSYWTYPDGAVAQRIAKMLGIPCVAMVGGSDVLAIDPAQVDAMGQRVLTVLNTVDAIATVSDHLKQRMVDLGVAPERILVLPPAVDHNTFSPGDQRSSRATLGIPADARVLVWAGRMVEVKALDVLIEATAAVKQTVPSVRLYLLGDGPLRAPLAARAESLGLGSAVVFAGRAPQDQLAIWYRAADLTVLPSHWEGTPNTLLESHACGIPFVATRVGAIPDLAIDGVDHLVAPGSASELSAAIAAGLSRAGGPVAIPRQGGWNETALRLGDLLAAVCRAKAAGEPQRVAPQQIAARA